MLTIKHQFEKTWVRGIFVLLILCCMCFGGSLMKEMPRLGGTLIVCAIVLMVVLVLFTDETKASEDFF